MGMKKTDKKGPLQKWAAEGVAPIKTLWPRSELMVLHAAVIGTPALFGIPGDARLFARTG
jgi:hypothetical protein